MAALDFPSVGLTVGQKYPQPATPGVPVYTWDGEKWTTIGGEIGSTGGADTPPPMDGTATQGVSTQWAREDHVHPTDTTRQSTAFTPVGGIAANTVSGAIAELDTEKVAKAGDTMTGPLVLSGNAAAALQAVPKQQLDILSTRTRQVFVGPLAGGTYTTPANCKCISVRMVGGGSGGQGNSADGVTITPSGAGGNTTFGAALTAFGGNAGGGTNYSPVHGGGATGGDFVIEGSEGGGGGQIGTTGGQLPGGTGGSSVFGSGGSSAISAAGSAAVAPGTGGGGGSASAASSVPGSGGGAGGYLEKLINSPAATYAYAVGGVGSGGLGITTNGGNGAPGLLIVDEFY